MNALSPRNALVAILISLSVFFAGCESMTAEQKAASFGVGAGVIAALAGVKAEKAIAIGAGVAALTYFAAKYQASEQQRKAAEANAKLAQVQLASLKFTAVANTAPAANPVVTTSPSPPTTPPAAVSTSAAPKQESPVPVVVKTQAPVTATGPAQVATPPATTTTTPAVASVAPAVQSKPELTKEGKPRYIAVDTARDARAQGAASVMIWDIQEQKVVGDTVYDLKTAPKTGEVAQFDLLQAVYVSSTVTPPSTTATKSTIE